MKAVLISIQPKWCKKIASGEKTIEVRKTRPKIDTPFKCYIYCTNDRKVMLDKSESGKVYLNGNIYRDIPMGLNGKVIGEFVCNKITKYPHEPYTDGEHLMPYGDLEKTCLDGWELYDYLKVSDGYGWHVSDLKIYDKPKELSEFWSCKGRECSSCNDFKIASDGIYDCFAKFIRPPQSWCYVEGLE